MRQATRRRVVALLSALAMSNAAPYGWGAATVEGDRVK